MLQFDLAKGLQVESEPPGARTLNLLIKSSNEDVPGDDSR
jgi:hypothetical protein